MRIGRTLPPAASPIRCRDLLSGILGQFTGKAEVSRLESELRDYFGRRHCFLVSSGKAALTLILQALHERNPDRDEVLIPAFTCYSVPSAIVRAGLKVKLADIDAETLDYDYSKIGEALKSRRLLCIVSIHLFGLGAETERLKTVVHDPKVVIVEDAAQGMGGEWQGCRLGTLGDVSFFSLGRGKALSAVEGGVILTDRDDIGRLLEPRIDTLSGYGAGARLALHLYALALMIFLRPALYWFPSALPFLRLGETRFDPTFRMCRMTPFQAGLTRGWRDKLEGLRKVRRENVHAMDQSLPSWVRRFWSMDKDVPDLIRFPLRVETEEIAAATLKESSRQGLGIALTYPDSVDSIPALRAEFAGRTFPEARRAARRLMTLPVHGYLTARDRERILRVVAAGNGIQGRVGWV